MTQIILDPNSPKDSSVTNWTPDHPIPKHLREWGYCPDYINWLPGDLILVSAINPKLIGRSIRKVQEKGGYPTDHARWEHAAVHVGAGALCEANRNGVCIGSIYNYASDHLIRIRRNVSLSQDQRWNLVVHALMQKGNSYDFFSIIDIVLKANNGFWNYQGTNIGFPNAAVICSQLYATAHFLACEQVLGNRRSGEITPAALSLDTKYLQDVQTAWLKIN